MLQDTSCSLISCLQLYSRSHLLPGREAKLATAKATPPTEVPTPSRPLMEHRTSGTLPTTCLGRHVLLWAHHTHQKDCQLLSVNWPKTWIFTNRHPDNPRSLTSAALGPSSWLLFRAPHPLEHSSVTENKLTDGYRLINYEHAQNIHHLSNTAGAKTWQFPTSETSSVSHISSVWSSSQGKNLLLALSTCTAC